MAMKKFEKSKKDMKSDKASNLKEGSKKEIAKDKKQMKAKK